MTTFNVGDRVRFTGGGNVGKEATVVSHPSDTPWNKDEYIWTDIFGDPTWTTAKNLEHVDPYAAGVAW